MARSERRAALVFASTLLVLGACKDDDKDEPPHVAGRTAAKGTPAVELPRVRAPGAREQQGSEAAPGLQPASAPHARAKAMPRESKHTPPRAKVAALPPPALGPRLEKDASRQSAADTAGPDEGRWSCEPLAGAGTATHLCLLLPRNFNAVHPGYRCRDRCWVRFYPTDGRDPTGTSIEVRWQRAATSLERRVATASADTLVVSGRSPRGERLATFYDYADVDEDLDRVETLLQAGQVHISCVATANGPRSQRDVVLTACESLRTRTRQPVLVKARPEPTG